MSDQLDLEIQYTVDDYVRALTFIQNRQFIVRHGLLFVAGIVFLVTVVPILLNQDSIAQYSPYQLIIIALPWVLILGIAIFLKYFPNPFLVWNIRRQFNTSPLLQETQHFSISDHGITGYTNISSAETKWPAIVEGVETGDDLYFFLSNKYAMFIPKRDLTDVQVEHIKRLADSNLGDKAKN